MRRVEYKAATGLKSGATDQTKARALARGKRMPVSAASTSHFLVF